MAESVIDFLADLEIPWYVFITVALLGPVIGHYLRTPREQWKREFFRQVVWYVIGGYVFVWAFHRFVLQQVFEP